MGNIFSSCKKKNLKIYNNALFQPLNTQDPYASLNLYNNLDFIEINEKIDSLSKKLESVQSNINILEENTQENIQLLSKDIHHINNILKIKPPVVV
tara:strand:+ start:2584 stop:2871 length:288 start_codon:yes stop_codon:yes gene_type:complete